MSLLRRLILAFAIVVGIGAGQGVLMLSNLAALGEKTKFVATKPIASVNHARAAWTAYRYAERHLSAALEMTRVQNAKSVLAEFQRRTDKLDRELEKLADATSSAAAAETLKAVTANISLWEGKARVLMEASPSTAIPAPHVLARIEVLIRNDLEKMVALALSDAATIGADVQDSVAASTRLSILLIVASIVAGLGLAVFCSLAITRPLARLDRTMRNIAAGDLGVAVGETERRDEVGGMARALEVFRRNTIEMRRLDAANAAADRQMREQELQLRTAMNNMRQALLMFDANGRLIVSNPQFAEMYGLPPECVVPGTAARRLLEMRVEAGTFEGDPDQFLTGLFDDATPSSKSVKLPDGRTISLAVERMDGGGWIATHEDVTERKAAEAKIEYMAHHDALTGLSNRASFRKRMEDSIARAKRGSKFAVLCLDLDRFKAVNDTLGHAIGDALLQDVSRRLGSFLRETDTLARLGGDEFAILQESVEGPGDAAALAKRLIGSISKPYELGGNQVVIGVSIGIALAPQDGYESERLMRNADLALYRAKDDGRGVYSFFDAQMDEEQIARQGLEADLRKALDRQQFEIYYQPIVDVATRTITGCEALLRWQHPRNGSISPDLFIPLAEETGLIESIGEWALHEACREAATWPAHVTVAVNLSPVQFRSRDLVGKIKRALSENGLSADRLELEITESVLLLEDDSTVRVLHALRDLGIRISMDDFGTGYSSLSYLRSFPFDKIKIDRSFINELSIDQDCSAIVKAVAYIGHGLGVATLAEGVETMAQFEQVRAQGCTQVQGYLFGAPSPRAAIRKLIARDQNKSDAA